MEHVKLKGNPIQIAGNLPAVGSSAPNFTFTTDDLSDHALKEYSGKNIILNIFPSIDTPVCASTVKKFNTEANKLENTIVLCVSHDLPFALNRFCGAEGLKNIVTGSIFRDPNFGKHYGVEIIEGPLRGLMSRAIVIIDANGKVIYTEQVPEIAQEPDYDKALAALKS